MSVHLATGDITRFGADAIVNAANSMLAPGGGVSGTIHAAGGPQIAHEGALWIAEHGEVATGSAAITTAGTLPARYVIHAVGPVWRGGDSSEASKLAAAYHSAIELADAHGDIRTIAFPSLSTGIFGYPVEQAAPVALRAVEAALSCARNVRDVTFVLYDKSTLRAYARAREEIEAE